MSNHVRPCLRWCRASLFILIWSMAIFFCHFHIEMWAILALVWQAYFFIGPFELCLLALASLAIRTYTSFVIRSCLGFKFNQCSIRKRFNELWGSGFLCDFNLDVTIIINFLVLLLKLFMITSQFFESHYLAHVVLQYQFATICTIPAICNGPN